MFGKKGRSRSGKEDGKNQEPDGGHWKTTSGAGGQGLRRIKKEATARTKGLLEMVRPPERRTWRLNSANESCGVNSRRLKGAKGNDPCFLKKQNNEKKERAIARPSGSDQALSLDVKGSSDSVGH